MLALVTCSTIAATEPYPSTYQARPGAPVLIRNATVLDGTGRRLDGAASGDRALISRRKASTPDSTELGWRVRSQP